jgi:IS30 family transposase
VGAVINRVLRVMITWVRLSKLLARWSPEQICHGLRLQFPDQLERWLCTVSIYHAVYCPDLGGLPRELPGRVRRRHHRVGRRHAHARRSGPVTVMTMIHERPPRSWTASSRVTGRAT